MTTSDWITIGSVLATMLSGTGILIFKIGGVINELKSLSATVAGINRRLDKHDNRIRRVEKAVAKLRHALYKP